MQDLHRKIADRSLVVGVLGLGYVGIPLAMRISESGFKVIGFDILHDRVAELNSGKSPIRHIASSAIQIMRQRGFEATNEFKRAADCDALIICVPTPLDKTREPDLSFVVATMDAIAPHLRSGQILSLESTTWPGTTREVLLPYVEEAGFNVGDNFFLVYSPEREDPGNESFTTRSIPKVVGGHTPQCLELGAALFGSFIDSVVQVSSTDAAELVKLLENIHRSVNIGLVNEMKIVADAMGLDIHEVIDAAKTKPFGFTAYYPGPGIGGHCIPIDPFYLTWKARAYGINTRFIELAGEINQGMPDYVIGKLAKALNEVGLPINGAKILVLGIAYKKNVDDMRESPAVLIMELIRSFKGDVAYSDPYVPVFPKMRQHSFDLSSVELIPENIAAYDAVVLATDHDCFDYDMIYHNARLIIDTRGKYRGGGSKIVKA